MRRRWMSAILALTMALALTACGGDSSSSSSNDSTPAESTPAAPAVEIPPVEDLTGTDTSAIPGLEDGVLTVGMECAYAPYNWTQMDDSNGAVPISNVPGAYANGYDVMIAQRICETYGWELEIVLRVGFPVPRRAVRHHGRQHRRSVHDRRPHEGSGYGRPLLLRYHRGPDHQGQPVCQRSLYR